MKRILFALALAGAASAGGCGSKASINTAPLTDEEKAAIKAQDEEIDNQEKAGAGSATKGKNKR